MGGVMQLTILICKTPDVDIMAISDGFGGHLGGNSISIAIPTLKLIPFILGENFMFYW